MNTPRNIMNKLFRQSGGATAEFLIAVPALLLLGLGGLQSLFIYDAKTTLTYATFEAAREGAVTHAQSSNMRGELAVRLAPIFGGDGSATEALESMAESMLEAKNPLITKIEILNPTREAFEDFGVNNPAVDKREIPNDNLRTRSRQVGARSGVSVQDANLLKIKVTYGYKLEVPVINTVLPAIMKWMDPANIAYYIVGRIPITAVATVRMQSTAWPDNNAAASGSGGTGAVPPETIDPGESQPPGGDPDNGDDDSGSNDDGGDSGSGSDDEPAPGDDTGGTDSGNTGGDTGEPGNGSTDCSGAGESTGTSTGLPALSVGNPINVTNGNKYQREADLSGLSGTLPLYFVRHYNSHGKAQGVLGFGWRHSYETSLRVRGDRIDLIQSDGRLLRFDASNDEADASRYLGRLVTDGVIIADAKGYLWRQPEGKRLRFSTDGRLQEIQWRGKRLRLHYDESGRLQQVSDSAARRLSLEYDAKGRLSSITDPAGRQTRYAYDARNNLEYVTRPDRVRRRYHYEDLRDRHNLTGITDERGVRYATWLYDAEGRAISSSHANRVEEVKLDYSTPGQTRVTDSQGRISTYEIETRDGIGQVLAIQGPGCSSCGGGDVRYRYNDRHQVIERTTLDGVTHHYRYDGLGRTVEITRQLPGEAPQSLLSYRYEGESRRPASIIRPSVKLQGEHRLDARYNEHQQPVELTERGYRPEPDGGYSPIERTIRLDYDAAGNLTRIDGPRDDVADLIRLAYDDNQRLRELNTPEGRTLRVEEYDDFGRPLEIRTSGQEALKLDYDERGNLVKVSQGSRSIRYDYDLANQLVGLTEADGKHTRIEYDAAGRATALEGPDGRLESTLDREGRPIRRSFSDLNGNLLATVNYLYDAQGRLNARRDSDGETRYHYDNGQLKAIEDPAGNLTELSYNGLGQLLAITQPENRATRLHYDNAGQAIGLTDPRDNTTRQLKDDFGNIVSRQHPDTGTHRYRHDSAGNLIAHTDPQGHTTEYRYDAANRLIEERTPDGTTHLTYDPENGRLAQLDDSRSRETFGYDSAGRLIQQTRHIDGHSFTTGYAYDRQGRLSRKRLPDGQLLDYHYYREGKQKGQLRAITRGGILGFGGTPLLGEIDQDNSDGETGLSFGNGLRETRRYDPQGQVREIRTDSQLKLRYDYDAQGRISGIDLDGMIQSYDYDAWGRLAEADTRLGEFRYTYDSLGNRTRKQHTDPAGKSSLQEAAYPQEGQGNRLLSKAHSETSDTASETQAYRYNGAGSPERIGARRYEYNSQQRPLRVYQQNAQGEESLLAEYAYNRFGERIKKVVYNNSKKPSVTYYLYDGHQLTAEADGQGRITAQYLYLAQRPVIKLEGERAYAIHSDHLGAPRLVTDDKQQLVWKADYSPFGLIEIEQARITLNLRLPGQYEDQETGTYYNYQRDYDPNTGRYLTSDPIGLKGGINLYAYVENNPLGLSDRLGLAPDGNSLTQGLSGIKPTATQTAALDLSALEATQAASASDYGDQLITHFAYTGAPSPTMCGDENDLTYEFGRGISLLTGEGGRPAIVYGDTLDGILTKFYGASGFLSRIGVWHREGEQLTYSYPPLTDREIEALGKAIASLPVYNAQRMQIAIPAGASNEQIAEEIKVSLGKLVTDEDVAALLASLPAERDAPLLVDIYELYQEILARYQTRLHSDERVWEKEIPLTQALGALEEHKAAHGEFLDCESEVPAVDMAICQERQELEAKVDEVLTPYAEAVVEVNEEMIGAGLMPLMDEKMENQSQARVMFAASLVDMALMAVPIAGEAKVVDALASAVGRVVSSKMGGAIKAVLEKVKVSGKVVLSKSKDISNAVVRRLWKTRPQSYFDELAASAARNPTSDMVVLGKIFEDGVGYSKVASHYNATYFKLGNWRELTKTMSFDDIWKINESFIRQQVKKGKQIILSHDPAKATGFYQREVELLETLGYKFIQDGWVWRAIR